MKSWGLTVNIRHDAAVEQYIEMHKSVWPEIIGPGGALEGLGIKTMQIFYCKPYTLFMYMETDDDFTPANEFKRANIEFDPRVKEWDDIMHGQLLQRTPGNAGPTEWFPLTKIFQYDERENTVAY
jgi:L-rhamnose mutarotase